MKKVEQEITYVDHMGTDLTVVNSARVSFAKKHEEFDECNDKKLIKYLANNDHFSPFTHCSIQFHVKCPIFVARQFFRHTVGFCYNEMSKRYVNNSPEYFLPKYLRQKDKNKKQGSKLEMIKNNEKYIKTMEDMTIHSIEVYNEIIEKGVAPELARMILPQNVMTEFYCTASLCGWARFYNLRIDSHAQVEIQELAQKISKVIYPLFPVSWHYLTSEDQTN